LMKTALLHIGTRKTGTTSIQNMLAVSRAVIAPVRYPLINGDRDQNRLVNLYLPRDKWPEPWRDIRPETCRKYRRFISRELAAPGSVIVSAESLSSWFDPVAAQKLREDLEGFGFRRFHVIIYFRDPAEYYLSNINQMLKNPAVSTPMGCHPRGFSYHMRRMTETWEQAFPGSLVVRKFPPTPESDVSADFSALAYELLGVSLPRIPERANPTISAEAMQIIQDYRLAFSWDDGRGLTQDLAGLVRFLQQSQAEVAQTKPVLKPEVAQCIRANHRADGDFIKLHYGVDLGLTESQSAELELGDNYRVSDLVEYLDPKITYELLLRLAKSELRKISAQRSPIRAAASRTYRAIRNWL
jgi:hypothetical protein